MRLIFNSRFSRKFSVTVDGWGSKFETTKYRTTDISEVQNCEYSNNES